MAEKILYPWHSIQTTSYINVYKDGDRVLRFCLFVCFRVCFSVCCCCFLLLFVCLGVVVVVVVVLLLLLFLVVVVVIAFI